MPKTEHLIQVGDATLDILDRRLDAEPLGERFLQVLRAFLLDTHERCSYHRKRLTSAGVRPQDVRSFEDWQRLPLQGAYDSSLVSSLSLLPDDLRAAMQEGTLGSMPAADRIVRVSQSGSSTGAPKACFLSAADHANIVALAWRIFRHVPLTSCSRVFNCLHGAHMPSRTFEEQMNELGAVVVNRHFAFVDLKDVVRQLTTGLQEIGGFNALIAPPWRPAGASTKGATLEELLDADDTNYIGRRIRVIVAGGSSLDEPALRLRERVREANELAGAAPTLILQRYGGSEIGLMAAECEEGGLHLCPGNGYVEIVDEATGRPVGDGQRGLVAVTAFRRGSRFLRYLIGDEAERVDEPCACGRATSRLREIRRVLDVQRLRGGCASGGY